jgi:hypothetical protein
MPRIDPVTGCTVMTHAEFWQDQAEREGQGRAPWELIDDFYAEIDRDHQDQAKRNRDPDVALSILAEAQQHLVRSWTEEMVVPLMSEAGRLRAFADRWACDEQLRKHNSYHGQDPDEAFAEYAERRENMARRARDWDPVPRPPVVLAVIEVAESDESGGLSENHSRLVAKCLVIDGNDDVREMWATHVASYWAGSRMEPPDEEWDVQWTDDQPEPPSPRRTKVPSILD